LVSEKACNHHPESLYWFIGMPVDVVPVQRYGLFAITTIGDFYHVSSGAVIMGVKEYQP